MLIKKFATCALAVAITASFVAPTEVMATSYTDLASTNHTSAARNMKKDELLKAVEITKLKWDDNAWAKALLMEEFDKFNGGVAAFIKKVTEIRVNNRKYVDLVNASSDAQEFSYDFSASGLRIKAGAFKEGINTIVLKAEGYMTKTIKFAKTGGIYSFLSQEDRDPNSSESPKINPEPLKKAIEEAKKIQKGEKSAEAWQNLKDAIAKAEVTLKTPVESQDVYDRELTDLEKAIVKFKKSENGSSEVKTPVQAGSYTLSFLANEEGKETSSMIQRVFDNRAKLVVRADKTMEVAFLNTKNPQSLIDFSISDEGGFPHAVKKGFGKKDKSGEYEAYEYTIPVKKLEHVKKAAALVTVMNGQISDKYNFSKYRMADFTFTSIKEGWDGYQKEIDDQKVLSGVDRLREELIAMGLDKNHDKKISKEEMAQYKDDKLVLNDCGLTDISMLKGLPATVKTIDLCRNNIKEIPKDLFKGMTGLENFWVENNEIKDIPKGAFKDNKNLKWIALTNNKITSLDEGDLSGAANLEQLGLEGNQISKISNKAFVDNRKLKSLSLVGNGMKKIPNDTFKPLSNSLRSLFIYENEFTNLPKTVSNLRAVEEIIAFDCKLKSIDDVDFSKMKELKDLNLHKNDITHVKNGAFKNNHKMEALDFYDNQLTNFSTKCLPPKVNYRKLDISMNNIKVVDPALARHQKYNKFYPQKSSMKLTLKKTGKKKVAWKEDLSILDLMFWQFYTSDYMRPEIDSVSGYKELLKDHGWDGKNFITMLNQINFDWDIVTELQKKNADGDFVTVSKSVSSDKADEMKGNFTTDSTGVYRLVKKMYTTIGGKKNYKFRVMSNELNMSGSKIKKVKKVSVGKVKKLKARAQHKKVLLKWSKVKNVSGYEIFMKKGAGKKFKTVYKNIKLSKCTIKKLKKNKKYSFKVRAFRKIKGKKFYGKYSTVKTVKIRR